MNESIVVIGHRNPDTDSIASAMSYAALKNKLGEDVVAGRLGTLNEETKFATRYFSIDAPNLVQDARCTLEDILMDQPIMIEPEASCNDALEKVIQTNNKTLYVCDKNQELLGILSVSDLSSLRLNNNEKRASLLKQTNLDILTSDVKGELLVSVPDFKTNGIVHIATNNTVEYLNDFKASIFIMSHNEELALEMIKKEAACIIFTHTDILSKEVVDAAREKGVALILSRNSIMEIASSIYEAIPVSLIMSKEVKSYQKDEFVDEVAKQIVNTRFRSYPVLDGKKVLGSISRYHLFKYPKKKFILVDHSSKGQTIDHIDSGEILEIIDHHHIGNIETNKPIYYRNQCCGCTCTIIYQMYKEHQLLPDKPIAGMMLSAIISDTLHFKSETTRKEDIDAATELAKIAGVDLDEYARAFLEASVNLKEADVLELLQKDLKRYDHAGNAIAVGQTNYHNIDDIQLRLKELQQTMQELQEKNSYDLLVMMFTHVMAEGTMFLYYGPKSNVMKGIIETEFDEHSGYDHVIMSRKQQLIPRLLEVIGQ